MLPPLFQVNCCKVSLNLPMWGFLPWESPLLGWLPEVEFWVVGGFFDYPFLAFVKAKLLSESGLGQGRRIFERWGRGQRVFRLLGLQWYQANFLLDISCCVMGPGSMLLLAN